MIKTAPKNNEKEGKLRPHLVPWDVLTEMLCPAYEEGLLKYVKESHRLGFKYSVMYDACQRHLNAFYFEKEDYDLDALENFKIKKHHLGGAIFSLISLYISQRDHKHLDDRGLDLEAYDHFIATGEHLKPEEEPEMELKEQSEDLKEQPTSRSYEENEKLMYTRIEKVIQEFDHGTGYKVNVNIKIHDIKNEETKNFWEGFSSR